MDNGPQPVAKEGRGSPLLEWWPAFVRYVPTLTILVAGLWTVITVGRIPNGAVLLILFAVVVFLVGLVSEQVSSLRFEGPAKR